MDVIDQPFKGIVCKDEAELFFWENRVNTIRLLEGFGNTETIAFLRNHAPLLAKNFTYNPDPEAYDLNLIEFWIHYISDYLHQCSRSTNMNYYVDRLDSMEYQNIPLHCNSIKMPVKVISLQEKLPARYHSFSNSIDFWLLLIPREKREISKKLLNILKC
jgi:hypothetical protein